VTRPNQIPETEFEAALRVARSGRHGEAIEQIERAVRAGPLPAPRKASAAQVLAQVARLAEAAGDAGQAERALGAALRLQPKYPDLHHRRARLLIALQRRAEARRSLERALDLNPGYPAARLELALLDAADGFIGEALGSLRALARETTVDEPAAFQQGLESLERAEWETAGALFARALALEPAGARDAFEEARASLESGDAARALELLESGRAGRESWPDLHFLLGSAELRCGRFDDALASLARALELNPDFHAARIGLARALEAVGALAQAGEQVALVLQREPSHPQALELQERWSGRGVHPAPAGRVRRGAAAGGTPDR
jgi:tetratricopeptide (TPR) repeat protein